MTQFGLKRVYEINLNRISKSTPNSKSIAICNCQIPWDETLMFYSTMFKPRWVPIPGSCSIKPGPLLERCERVYNIFPTRAFALVGAGGGGAAWDRNYRLSSAWETKAALPVARLTLHSEGRAVAAAYNVTPSSGGRNIWASRNKLAFPRH